MRCPPLVLVLLVFAPRIVRCQGEGGSLVEKVHYGHEQRGVRDLRHWHRSPVPPPLPPPDAPSSPPPPLTNEEVVERSRHKWRTYTATVFGICFGVISVLTVCMCCITEAWKPDRVQESRVQESRGTGDEGLRRDIRALQAHLSIHTGSVQPPEQRKIHEAIRTLPVGRWVTDLDDPASTTSEAPQSAITSAPATSDKLLVALRPSTAERAKGRRPSAEADVHTNDATCAVCLNDFCAGDELRLLPCGHSFHLKCIDKWLQHARFAHYEKEPTCPLCNQPALPKPLPSTVPQPKPASSGANPRLASEPALAPPSEDPAAPSDTHPEAAHASGTCTRLLGRWPDDWPVLAAFLLIPSGIPTSPARVQPAWRPGATFPVLPV